MASSKHRHTNIIKIIFWSLFSVFAILFPFMLNSLIIKPRICPVAGTASDWLNFWGTYISSIASAAMLFIALKNIRENHKENSDNRLIQVKMMIYEQEKAHINILADRLWQFQVSFDMLEVLHQVENMKTEAPNYENIFCKLKELIRNVDQSDFAIDLFMPKTSQNEYEAEYNKLRNQIYSSYGTLIMDLNSFCDLLRDYPKEKTKQRAYIEYHLENTLTSPETPLTKIIEKNKDNNIYSIRDQILKELVYTKSTEISELKEELKKVIYNLIQFENMQLEKDFYLYL